MNGSPKVAVGVDKRRTHLPTPAESPILLTVSAELCQARFLCGLPLRRAHRGFVPLSLLIACPLLSLPLLLGCICSANTCLSGGLNHCSLVSPGVQSPVHPVPKSSCRDPIGSGERYPLTIAELSLLPAAWQSVQCCQEVTKRPACREEVFGQERQMPG